MTEAQAQELVATYRDSSTNTTTLTDALDAWIKRFGSEKIIFGIKDPVPLDQGHILGRGGLGHVYETKIEGISVAWKRIYRKSVEDLPLNEVKILGQLTKESNKHVVKLIGSYIHRHRCRNYELAILTWPVAHCDLAVFLAEVDLVTSWKARDKLLENGQQPEQPTDDEELAFRNLLMLEQLEQESSTTAAPELREHLLGLTSTRLSSAIGCIAGAVKYLHGHGIRHKDIKPSQVLLSPQGIWLTDFGGSQDTSHLTSSETSGGEKMTIRYQAPERAHMRPRGRPEDIFALGCTYLEMGYRIYGENVSDYLNLENYEGSSFQAHLEHKEAWLAPFRTEKMTSRAQFGVIIDRMIVHAPQERIPIDEVIQSLQDSQLRHGGRFFGQCCAPKASPGFSTSAVRGHINSMRTNQNCGPIASICSPVGQGIEREIGNQSPRSFIIPEDALENIHEPVHTNFEPRRAIAGTKQGLTLTETIEPATDAALAKMRIAYQRLREGRAAKAWKALEK